MSSSQRLFNHVRSRSSSETTSLEMNFAKFLQSTRRHVTNHGSQLLPGPLGSKRLSVPRHFHQTCITNGRWAKVAGKKTASDAKKGALYSKAIQNIAIAAKVGGSPDPTINHALAAALKSARSSGVPKDNIQSAMNRITNPSLQDAQQSTTYEAIGPGQVGLVIECLTDNTTRTAKKVREILSDNNARLAPVAYLFSRCGQIRLTPVDGTSYEEVWDLAVDAGAEDVSEIEADASESGSTEVVVTTPPNLLATLASKLSNHTLHSVELAYVPAEASEPELSEPDQKSLEELIEELEDSPDVVRVWTSI